MYFNNTENTIDAYYRPVVAKRANNAELLPYHDVMMKDESLLP